MLKTLQTVDSATRQRVLSSVSRRLLPHPAAEEEVAEDEHVRSLQDGVLAELGVATGVQTSTEARPAMKHVFRVLSAALSDSVMTAESNMKAKERLGNSDLVKVSTIHERLWALIKDYQKELVKIHVERFRMSLSGCSLI